MTDTRNKAPYGWYVGSYLLRFVELADKRNNEAEKRYLTWENTIIVKARNLAQAYDKLVKLAKRETKPYKGGVDGIDVQWRFEGVTKLLPIYEKLGDGAEIIWADHGMRKLATMRKRARTKRELLHDWMLSPNKSLRRSAARGAR